jgi:DUF1009 family protein
MMTKCSYGTSLGKERISIVAGDLQLPVGEAKVANRYPKMRQSCIRVGISDSADFSINS